MPKTIPTPFMLLGYPPLEGSQIYRGRVIVGINVQQKELDIHFNDGTTMRVVDDGQSCCESRFMTCDDDIDHYIGSEFVELAVVLGPNVPAEYDHHEIQFLVVGTSLGTFTVTSHNEHNGYYGGFNIKIAGAHS